MDELISFLNDKELVLITNWMQYGNFENFKVKDFLEDILFLREDSESKYIPVDDFCDVRIYLTRVDEDTNQDRYPETTQLIFCDYSTPKSRIIQAV